MRQDIGGVTSDVQTDEKALASHERIRSLCAEKG